MKKTFLFWLLTFSSISILSALNPSRTYQQLPSKYNMKYEAVMVSTNDGKAKLKLWNFSSKKTSSPLIILTHSGEGNMGDYLRRVDQFLRLGYQVVTFDYRGFGESSEFEIDNNMFIYPQFIDDLNSVIDFCRKNYQATFDIYGWGMGAGLSLGVGWHRPEINKIISDTPFLSMEDLEERFSDWEEPMEVPFAGYDKKFEPIHAVKNTPIGKSKKVMLIIGSNDILFKKEDMKMLQNKKKKIVKDIFIVENPDRKDNFKAQKAKYFKEIEGFLNSK